MFSALIGYPVDHSVSPKLFAYLSNIVDLEYNHIKINTKESGLQRCIDSLLYLGAVGINVTLPYKTSVMKFIKYYDDSAILAGSVNTIRLNGKDIYGYNTDGSAAVEVMIKTFKKITSDDSVLILGSGGCARGIISALLSDTDRISIAAINSSEAKHINEHHNLSTIITQSEKRSSSHYSFSYANFYLRFG